MRIAAIALVAFACGQQAPDQKLLNDVQPAVSWIATLQFASECWLDHRAPTSFVRNTIDAADSALEKAAETVDKSKAAQQLRGTIQQQVRVARTSAAEAKAALSRGDVATMTRARARFAAAYAALDALEKQQQ